MGRLLFELIRETTPQVTGVGGLTMGADPLASAVSLVSHLGLQPLAAFLVRKEPKGHGSGQWIEGLEGMARGADVHQAAKPSERTASIIKRAKSRQEPFRERSVISGGCVPCSERRAYEKPSWMA